MYFKYVIITPAQNEEENIEKTIKSVINQTLLPQKWIIVNDGSTDQTVDIVNSFIQKHDFIQLINIPQRDNRNFSSKVHAFNIGYKQLKGVKYEFIGNLDADISFNRHYYEKILQKFHEDKKIGICGGDRYDIYNGKCLKIVRSRSSVMGAVQLFRRQCYEDIGGYIPLERGGIDAVAEIMARMQGWKVVSFPNIIVYHHRRTGSAVSNVLTSKFREGHNDYVIGYHLFFELIRCLGRTLDKPYILGSLSQFSGYCWGSLTRCKKKVPNEVVKYIRSEQISRIREILLRPNYKRFIQAYLNKNLF